jgi:hypothetical protein
MASEKPRVRASARRGKSQCRRSRRAAGSGASRWRRVQREVTGERPGQDAGRNEVGTESATRSGLARAGKVGTTDQVLDVIRGSGSRQRAGHPARFATRRMPRRPAASCTSQKTHRRPPRRFLPGPRCDFPAIPYGWTSLHGARTRVGRSVSCSDTSGSRTHQFVGSELWSFVHLYLRICSVYKQPITPSRTHCGFFFDYPLEVV